ncbi:MULTISPECIES: malonyl-CoA decarboxylase [Roseobacteraceae]|uniref:Malonyl-CoA decarboxylase (MCD) n=1 Tax=Pseudosulfitobacter pseudonitzschiae TaxID=1402135 RepID=A0A221K784_9RHOB|nr:MULTISPECIES: malonyl-CoA decarboxylase [Roseobacteraceae]ASM74733.1 malonyl-CoA decarboxylase (MCD) [Pseudosulfitobacter pseudonitzschiae]
MTILADLLSTMFERRYRSIGQRRASSRPIESLIADLLGNPGETSEVALARDILGHYENLDDTGKLAFLRHLAHDMNIDPETVRTALDTYEQAPSKLSYRAFMAAAEPQRQELIRRLNRVPGATGALVRMRADLLRLAGDDPELAALDLDFRHLFVSWFNRGFLVLRPISWESPAHILEKITAYEAVHAIQSWDDLRRRLQPHDRRCFAFFHPAMPDEPLIFVEVALTKGTPGSVQALLAEDRAALDPEDCDTAVFYSISNCQAGLASISFGNSLIKQVAADLSAELEGLKSFVTLSPIPLLTKWAAQEGIDMPDAPEARRALAAHYLLMAKGRGDAPFDPVARFHLGNGALVHAVHANADASDNGAAQSGGVMVNYLYDLDQVAQNHENFATKRKVTASSEVTSLAKTFASATSAER